MSKNWDFPLKTLAEFVDETPIAVPGTTKQTQGYVKSFLYHNAFDRSAIELMGGNFPLKAFSPFYVAQLLAIPAKELNTQLKKRGVGDKTFRAIVGTLGKNGFTVGEFEKFADILGVACVKDKTKWYAGVDPYGVIGKQITPDQIAGIVDLIRTNILSEKFSVIAPDSYEKTFRPEFLHRIFNSEVFQQGLKALVDQEIEKESPVPKL